MPLLVLAGGLCLGALAGTADADSAEAQTPAPAADSAAQPSLEQRLKEAQKSYGKAIIVPSSEPVEVPVGGGIEQSFLMALGLGGALVTGAITVIARRRRNPWLDKPSPELARAASVLAEDPSMVEFLHALREGPQIAPVAVVSGKPVRPDPVSGTTAGSQPQAGLSPPERGCALVRKELALLRKTFPKLTCAVENAQRLSLARQLVEQVDVMKKSCLSPDLRPVWLLACALRGLLHQFSSKAANISPSAVRTAAAAVDLMEHLCSRSHRSDLATEPPPQVLAVDDEPISRQVVVLALKKAFAEPHVAADGPSALAMASQRRYDVIFLDVEMPGMDGYELCSKIHETPSNRATPVVFVTSHSDFDSRAKSTLVGAHDLIAKPFLAFEITVKALTLVLRARLDGVDSRNPLCEPPKTTSAAPAQDSALVPTTTAIAPPPSTNARQAAPLDSPGPTANKIGTAPNSPSDAKKCPVISACGPVQSAAASPQPSHAVFPDRRQSSSGEFARAFFRSAPAHLQVLRQQLASSRKAALPTDRQELLGELFIGVHMMSSEAGRAQLGAAFRIGSALEAMLKKLLERPSYCAPSTLEAAAAALDTLDQLCQARADLDLAEPAVRLLVVDDDPVARRAIGGALQLAFGRPDSTDCGEAALLLAGDKPYDLIFLDVIMPGMDGFATCPKLHETALNRRTPVVFVTSQNDTAARTEAAAAGGCGFIPKPVLPSEITLQALTHILRGRLERRAEAPGEQPAPLPERECALAG